MVRGSAGPVAATPRASSAIPDIRGFIGMVLDAGFAYEAGGSVYFETPVDIPPPVAVAVTLEPAGGVPAPTGAMYLVGKPSPL